MPHQLEHEHSPGEMIHGRYEIISFISRGGFGETYKVEDTQRARLICLLKYLKPLNTSPNVLRLAQERFVQEADTLRRLGNHNQIPELYDYFEENERFYLVEEFVDGQNLAYELRAGLFSETQVIEVLYDVLKILDYLYQKSVIHRDIKPENLIRRSSDNKIVLVDFGAVKEVGTLVLNAQGQTILTMAIGTPGFMAPEQSDRRPKFASDIYALGITALFLFTRQIPSNQVDDSFLSGVQIQPYLAKILEKMVRYKYEERYETAADALADLEPLTLLNQTLNQRYEIQSYLGGGGLSHTYFAKDNQRPYQPDCIIKQLKLKYNNQRLLQEAQTRFATTVQSLGRLFSHQQIPQISDHFQKNQELYLVHDFIQGEPLSRQVTAGNRLSEAEVIILLKDVLEILSFIHQQGVIHGDIKPSNLIRRQDGKFCLIDFAEFKQITNLTINNQNIFVPPGGTNGYMAPEQYQNKLQHNSDIYALGITAIQALTAISPDQLQTDSQNEVTWRNKAKTSPKLARILDKMVRFQTGKRYQSAQKVLDDLNAETLREKINKHKRVIAIMILAASLAITYRVYVVLQEQKAETFFNNGTKKKDSGDNAKNAEKTKEAEDKANKYYNEAITNFQKAIDINPKLTKAWVNQGYAYGKLKNVVMQSYSCVQAIYIDNNSSEAWICIGNAHLAAKEYQNSIDSFKKAVSNCNPQAANNVCAPAWNGIGDSYLALNQPKEAINAYEKALSINQDFQPAKDGIAKAKKLLEKKP